MCFSLYIVVKISEVVSAFDFVGIAVTEEAKESPDKTFFLDCKTEPILLSGLSWTGDLSPTLLILVLHLQLFSILEWFSFPLVS